MGRGDYSFLRGEPPQKRANYTSLWKILPRTAHRNGALFQRGERKDLL